MALKTELKDAQAVPHLGHDDDVVAFPKTIEGHEHWIRGTVDYERWLAHRMQEDLEITWRDDRGGEERMLNNWEVKETGRYLEFRPRSSTHSTGMGHSIPVGRPFSTRWPECLHTEI